MSYFDKFFKKVQAKSTSENILSEQKYGTDDVVDLENGNVRVSVKYLYSYKHIAVAIDEELFWSIGDKKYIIMTKEKFQEMEKRHSKYIEKENKLYKCCELNNLGIKYEKEGDVDKAVNAYEENINIGYPARHSYDRLLVLYRKRKDYDNEERVAAKAYSLFGEEKYAARLEKIQIIKTK